MSLVLLPQRSANGYYSYSRTEQQYGTRPTIDAIIAICRAYYMMQHVMIGIGDMSYSDGRVFPPHNSHRDGKCADIRPVATARAPVPMNIHRADYDRDATALLIVALRAHDNVLRILFNDRTIVGVVPYAGHDNHMHVIMKS